MNKIVYKVLTGIILAIVTVVCYGFLVSHEIISKGDKGVKAVKLLYDFDSVSELASNLEPLSNLTTREVFDKVAASNEDKALNTYLKFKQNPVEVEIISKQPGCIIYTLNTSSLSSGRKFIFVYSVDFTGKIDSVRELEGIDFYK